MTTPACDALHGDGATRCALPAGHLDTEPTGFHESTAGKQWRKVETLRRPGERTPYGFRVNDRVTSTPDPQRPAGE